MSSRTRILTATLGITLLALVGTAVATAPSGQQVNLLVRATGRLHAHHDGIAIKTRRRHQTDVAVATVTYPPGASSGWHHHPGLVVIAVQSGTVTFYDAKCRSHAYPAGRAFIEASNKPGLARNAGTENAVAQATFILPTTTPPSPLRIEDAQPAGCTVT
jgi:quercetin dioxygenase-like cupin family protein